LRRAQPSRNCPTFVALFGAMLFLVQPASAQTQLGHKLLAGAGVDAGTQSESGLYLLDRFAYYSAERLNDQAGHRLPIRGLDIEVYGNMLGLALTIKPRGAPYLSIAAAAPMANIHVSVSDPRVTIDRSGFGDLYVQPIKLGWKQERYDVVSAYSFYAPTGEFEPRRGGVGRGYWTHQFSLGGAIRSRDRILRASALASYDLNLRKRSIDIRRGNMFQLQGGAGLMVFPMIGIGVASYALWQVSDDVGTDIPPALRGLRTRVFGLGPELNLILPKIGLRADTRLEWDLGARSRPEGIVLVTGIGYRAWYPGAGAVRTDR
jgi:hypothetical protein